MPALRYLIVLSALCLLFGCEEPLTADGFNGYVEAEYLYATALESGWIISSAVREGDTVERGQILFELDKDRQVFDLSEAQASAAQAEAQYHDLSSGARPDEINRLDSQRKEALAAKVYAESEKRRLTTLRRKGVVAQSSVDQAVAEFNAANARVDSIDAQIRLAKLASRENTVLASKAALERAQNAVAKAQWRLDQRTVHARRAARVEQLYFREGEQLASGAPALALLPDDGLKIRFFVPQSQLINMPVGSKLGVKQDGTDKLVSAEVSYIASEPEYTPPVIYSVASRQKLVFLVEAKLASGSGLHPGQPVDIFLQAGRND